MARPRENVHYERLALAIARRRFPTVWAFAADDLRQECALLAWEAQTRSFLQVGVGARRKLYGSGTPGRHGVRSFSRAAYARLYRVARNYGWRRVRPD